MITSGPRDRSPNYPAIPLEQAVEAVRRFYDRQRRGAVPPEVAAKSLGFNSLSGPAKSRLAALRQYGLMESDKQHNIRLSSSGLTLAVSSIGTEEYEGALREAALGPPIFAELYESRREVDDEALRYYLVRERRFSPEGAIRLIAAYRSSMSLAKLDRASSDEIPDDVNHDGQGGPGKSGDTAHGAPSAVTPPATTGGEKRLYFLLTGQKSAEITLRGGELTKRDFDKLVKLINITAEDIDDGADRAVTVASREELDFSRGAGSEEAGGGTPGGSL